MNILNISRTMGQGGAEKVVLDLCENTSTLFENVVVVSIGGINVKKLNNMGVKHIQIPDLNSKNINDILKTIKIINNVVKQYNIDVIHSHHRMGAFYAQIIKKLNKDVKLIYTAHNIFNDKCVLTKVSLINTQIVAVGEGVKKNLMEFFNISNKYIEVIKNSVKSSYSVNYVRPIECDENKKVISCIGRLTEQKGMEYFINAISLVKDMNLYNDLKVLIIGDGELKENLNKEIKRLELENIIEIIGYRSNIYEYIKFSDFIVSSSLWEGFPLTPIECFSIGKTIITTDISGNNEIVIDGYNGLLVEPKNSKDLAKKIIKLLDNGVLLNKLENNAKKTYIKSYSYDDYISKYIKIYKGLL